MSRSGTGAVARFAGGARAMLARPGRLPRTSAFLLGAATVTGFAPAYLFPVPIATLAALLLLCERAPGARAAAGIGFAFGLGFFLAGVSWVYVSLNVFGAMPAVLAGLTTLAFCAYLALYPALATAVARLVPGAFVRRALVFPGVWVLGEWLRGWFLTGFPWLASGYSQVPWSPLAGFGPVLGVHGIGLATVAVAGLALHAIRTFTDDRSAPRSTRLGSALKSPALLTIAMLTAAGAVLGTHAWTQPVGPGLQVSLLQGNVPQDMKWRPEQVEATLATYLGMIERAPGTLVVLPETALPLFLHQVPASYLDAVRARARARGADVLVGLPERGEGTDYYNSVVSFGVSPQQTYRKVHLVPFGEFVPLRPLLAPVVAALAIPLTDFGRGRTDQRPLAVAGERVAINICYEDAFGEEIIRQLPEATVLVNVSNVAWFGDSLAPAQHLQIAQTRAIETGRVMLRATNTGMTAIVEPSGRIAGLAPTFTRAVVSGRVQGYQGATPFVTAGNLPAVLLALACALAGIGSILHARRAAGTPSPTAAGRQKR